MAPSPHDGSTCEKERSDGKTGSQEKAGVLFQGHIPSDLMTSHWPHLVKVLLPLNITTWGTKLPAHGPYLYPHLSSRYLPLSCYFVRTKENHV
jgi:hypothetical protein